MSPRPLTAAFTEFAESEQSGGLLLVACILVALALANSPFGPAWQGFWQQPVGPLTLSHWINDGLMAVFFLLIGLELERELYVGELSNPRQALLPVAAALGGMAAPALIHYALNGGTPTQAGFGIPMATDIAFALGVLALLGNRIPGALKVFVVAFAVIDDLGAIVVIAAFYSKQVSLALLFGALAVWAVLLILNLRFRVVALLPYLLGGVLMWGLLLGSGVHATLAGVLLAFAIPFAPGRNGGASPSHRLEHRLHLPVTLGVLPLFALANSGIAFDADSLRGLAQANSLGILAGLLLGKPLGVTLLCLAATRIGLCRLPDELRWAHIFGAGLLGGIGFTMSIFITQLAFDGSDATVASSKLAILLSSVLAACTGYAWLRSMRPAQEAG